MASVIAAMGAERVRRTRRCGSTGVTAVSVPSAGRTRHISALRGMGHERVTSFARLPLMTKDED